MDSNFSQVDELCDDLTELYKHKKGTLFLENQYAGIICAVGTTAYEVKIIELFTKCVEACRSKGIRWGQGTSLEDKINSHRFNAGIKTVALSRLMKELCGNESMSKYLFNKVTDDGEVHGKNSNVSGDLISSAYDNLINSRHSYIHAHTALTTLPEAILYYDQGKEEINRIEIALTLYVMKPRLFSDN